MKNKKISIIIPIYKVEQYLYRCIESVVNQTYQNLEIILVDDGSPDNCPKMCDDWAEKDKRIKVIHKENGGVSSARNLGLEKATGDYIAFVDSDDILDKEMIQKLYSSVVENNSDLSMCKYSLIYEKDNRIIIVDEFNLIKAEKEKIFEYLFKSERKNKKGIIRTPSIMGSVCRILYKKTILKGLKFEKLKICEDLNFLIDLLKLNPKISIVNEYLYYYFQRETSSSHVDPVEMNKRKLEAVKVLYSKIADLLPSNLLKANKYHFYTSTICTYMRHGLKKELKKLIQTKFMKDLGAKENYKCAMKAKRSLKYKIAYWMARHKLIWIMAYM